MCLLRNKVFILVLFLVVLLALAVVGYKAFSIYSFNSLSKELDTGNNQLFSGFKDEIATSNKISTNLYQASASLCPTFSKEKNDGYLKQTKIEYNNSLSSYKKGLADLDSNVSRLSSASKMPLWLSGDQKKFVSDITSSLKDYQTARKSNYDLMVEAKPVINNTLQIISDTGSLVDYILPLQNAKTQQQAMVAITQNFSKLAPLEKYSKDSYKFEGQDTLASKYPDSYKAFTAFKTIFGQYYLAIKGVSEGDMTKALQLNQVAKSFENSLNTLQDPFTEVNKTMKPSTIKIKDAYTNYANALDFYAEKKLYFNPISKHKLLVRNNQNKAIVVAYATDIYQIDNEKPPADKSFADVVKTLQASDCLGSDLECTEADFTYKSDGAMYYKIGYKDEFSGTVDTFTIGITKETQNTLGVSTVKINGVDLDLSSVSVLTNYVKSLTY
jgi:hypothetical protein